MVKSNTLRAMVAFMVLSILSVFASVAFGAEVHGKMTDVATCNDGMVYSSLSGDHRGACRGHHGVRSWSDGSPVKSKGRKSTYRKAGSDTASTVSVLDLSAPDAPESEFPTITDKGKL